MKINFFNAEHTHALIDLPTDKSIEQVIQLLKGSSLALDQRTKVDQREI